MSDRRDPSQFLDTEAERDSETHSNRADDSSENDSDVPDEFEQDDFITYDQEDEGRSASDEGDESESSLGKRKRMPHPPLWMDQDDENEPQRKKRKTGYKRLKKKKSTIRDEEEEVIQQPPRDKDLYRGADEDMDDMSSFIVGQSREDVVEQGAGHSLAANIFGDENPMENEYEGGYIDEDEEFFGEQAPEDKYNRLKKLFSREILKAKFMTERDDEIRELDIPERFQLRQGERNVTADEINREAHWLIRQLYEHRVPIHTPQDDQYVNFHNQITYVLKQLLQERSDVPYITQYLKEYWSELLIEDDLWKIYEWDNKWFKLQEKKAVVEELYNSTTSDVPTIYKDMLREVSTMEEIKDLSQHFRLHFQSEDSDGYDIRSSVPNGGTKKKPVRRDTYSVAKKTPGFVEFAKKIALSSHDYAHNLRAGIMLHFAEDPETLPEEMASTYTSRQFSSSALVLKFVRHIHAYEIAKEPYVRSVVRRCYEQYAEMSTQLTPKGRTAGAFRNSTSKDLKNVSLQAFRASDEQYLEFMRIMQAKRDGLLKVTIQVPDDQLDLTLDPTANYHSDKTNNVAAAWNKQRSLIIEEAKSILKKQMTDYVLDQYLKHGSEIVGKKCFERVTELLNHGPYSSQFREDPAENYVQRFPPRQDPSQIDETELTKHSVLACAPGRNRDEPTAFVFLDANGELQETILWRFPAYVSKEVKSLVQSSGNVNNSSPPRSDGHEPNKTEQQLTQEKQLIFNIKKHKPEVLAIGASGLQCRTMYHVIDHIQQRIPEDLRVKMQFVRDDIARMYENSEIANQELKEIPHIVRRAMSLGRFINDPLTEIARLFNAENDLLVMKIHPLQDMLRTSQLKQWIEQAFIRVVCRVGVDLNRIVMHKHMQASLQFVSGLGPRKADALIKHVVSRGELHARADLKDAVGDIVYKNCAGFLKIASTKRVEDEAGHFRPFDSTRIHPSNYDLAEKICFDALDVDQEDDEDVDTQIAQLMDMYDENGHWVGAAPGTEEQDKLEDLDLDLYAQNLEDMGYGKKSILLTDIKEELKCPFRDTRLAYHPMTYEEVFYSATTETRETFHMDSLVFITITDVLFGVIFGYLDNGLRGSLRSTELPIQEANVHLSQFYSVGQSLEAVVKNINYVNFSIELSASEAELEKHQHVDTENITKLSQNRKKILKRNVNHPYFKNFDYKQAQEFLENKPAGECVIRPSSKGSHHLALTFKWYGGTLVNVDIREDKKTTPFTLGKELWVKKQKFEDLDDVHYNMVELVIENAEQVVQHPKYVEGSKEEISQKLRDEKKKNPKIIPYALGVYKKYPGRFFIYYLPGAQTVLYEPIYVTGTGLQFLGKPYQSPTKLINYFKKHYKELPSLRRRQEARSRGASGQTDRSQAFGMSDSW